jgi:hypothetical protein
MLGARKLLAGRPFVVFVLDREAHQRWTVERYVSMELGERGWRVHVAGWTLFIVTGMPRDQDRDEYEALVSFIGVMGPADEATDFVREEGRPSAATMSVSR